jgi:hypothetical protein
MHPVYRRVPPNEPAVGTRVPHQRRRARGLPKHLAECLCLQAWGRKPDGRPGRQGHGRTTRCQLPAYPAEYVSMDQQHARKTFTYKLLPTPEQERTLESVVWRCGVGGAAASSPTLAWKNAKRLGKRAASRCAVPCNRHTCRPSKRSARSTARSTRRSSKTCCTAWIRRLPPSSAASQRVSTPPRLPPLAGHGPLHQLHLSAGRRA